MLSVSLCVICGALAYAATGQDALPSVFKTTSGTVEKEASQNFGVSIGTVDAQSYSESGLTLNNFSNAEYVARLSENTYMGFDRRTKWVYNDSTGEETKLPVMSVEALSTTEEAVAIPDSIRINGEVLPVAYINADSYLYNGFTENIKILTVPSTISEIEYNYQFDRYLDAMYMLGDAPAIYSTLRAKSIYVCDKTFFGNYLNNERFSSSAILPYGWDFEWITVNVEKNGEFAETYLTQNNYDWNAALYLKVTGNINDIDLSAIKNVTALMKLDLSETTITELPAQFMYNRTSLAEVKLPSSLVKIGESAFNGCSALKSFDLNGIKTIENSVFSDCQSLSYINLAEVDTIGSEAFYNCNKLDNIDLSNVVNIGSQAFYGCSSLQAVNLSAAESLGSSSGYSSYGSFQNCTSLKEVTFGNRLNYIGRNTFNNTGLITVSIPEGVTSLEGETFENCKSLTSVELPATLTAINSEEFRGCTALTTVTMKTGLKQIGDRAFYECSALEEITIPSTVGTIGSSAFSNTAIKNFKCYAVVPPAASSAFIGENMDMTRTYLHVPPFSKDFYRNTQYWSNFYLMRSIQEQIDYILVDRELTINLEEEDNEVVANNPTIDLRYSLAGDYYDNNYNIGQLTATGEGTLSAGQLTVTARLANRGAEYSESGSENQYCPTLINYADKMRADNVTHNITFNNDDYYDNSGIWHFISLPYDVKVSDIIPSDNTHWVIRRYDSAARAAGELSETWVNLTNDDTLEAGKGYIVSAVGGTQDENGYTYPALSFTSGNSLTKNNIFRSTDVIVPLSEYPAEFAHNRSWNFIGNPYPCYFDMHCLNEEFTAPVTVWNSSAYVAYSPVDDDLVLSPYEAFFVQCPLDANEVTFKETGRMHSNEGRPAYKTSPKNNASIAAEDRNVFNFILSGEKYEDRVRIVLNPEATAEYEIGRDASKFFAANNDNAQLYVNSGVNYSIDERPVSDGKAELGLRSAKEKAYTLSLGGRYSDEWSVMLTDNVTGITLDLTKEDYQFISSTGENTARFSINFDLNGNGQSGVDAIFADFGKDAVVSVTAINGTVVYTGTLADVTVPSAGLYIISNGSESRKAILK